MSAPIVQAQNVGFIPAINGSMRGVRVINVPNALAALVRRTSLEVSAKDFANVRCSCGKNGFKNVGIFSSRLFSVRRIAAAPRLAPNKGKADSSTYT